MIIIITALFILTVIFLVMLVAVLMADINELERASGRVGKFRVKKSDSEDVK